MCNWLLILKKLLKECKVLRMLLLLATHHRTAAVMVLWLTKRGIPTLLDVKDQWPSIFLDALPAISQTFWVCNSLAIFRLAKRAMQECNWHVSNG